MPGRFSPKRKQDMALRPNLSSANPQQCQKKPKSVPYLGEVECRSEPIVHPSHHGRRKGSGSTLYVLGIKQFNVAKYVPMNRLARLNLNRTLRRSDLGKLRNTPSMEV
jgi:hypothetical protein